jgi:DNA-binding response OmpR family regulator
MARILVVDGDADMRAMLRQALGRSGHQVVEAKDRRTGVELHRVTPPDVIVLDIHMGDDDGMEMLLDLRRDGCKAKIVAMSSGGAHGDFAALRKSEEFGAIDSLVKPFDLGTLRATIRRVLGEK